MLKEAVYHVAHGSYAYPVGPTTLRVTLRAARGDLQQVKVIYKDRYQGAGEQVAVMELVAVDELFAYYQADLELWTKRFAYIFYLDDGRAPVFYTEKGFFADPLPRVEFQYPYIALKDLWEPPKWAQGAVFYQIFPERFANGDPANDPPNVEPWDARPTPTSQKGGDLRGIIQKLDYLADLGVDAIYLTPIFASPSNHKYDTTDYYKIDPHFGDLDDVRELVTRCHNKGIRVIFDAVFNHAGMGFFAFQDVLKHGEKSRFADWFNIYDWPIETDPPNYETFADGIATMPKLMTNNPEVRAYLLDVAKYWIEEADIDGWRLDVANEIDHDFWREFRRVVKQAKPDALIVGEIWHESSDWLRGDQFDCVMNYPIQYACLDFFAARTIRADSFANRLAKVQINHTHSVNLAMFNLLGSHDTARFLTECAEKKERLMLAAAFILTYEGAPMIYYGDEVGMVGETDPDCRRGMIWDPRKQDHEIRDWYKDLIALRRARSVLRTGQTRVFLADSVQNLIGYARYDDEDQVLVILNNSDYERTINMKALPWPNGAPGHVKELLTDTLVDSAQLIIPPLGTAILG
ncbi:MAG: alpha-glycosidase [Firmicutes bacterium]|nr:alpha-glycosidase [Bacillota bacterium]